MPIGEAKRACPRVASTAPRCGASPASVATQPSSVEARIVWLRLSAMYSSPDASNAIPRGEKNRAPACVPSREPASSATPATVTTDPSGATRRRTWLGVSVT